MTSCDYITYVAIPEFPVATAALDTWVIKQKAKGLPGKEGRSVQAMHEFGVGVGEAMQCELKRPAKKHAE